MYYKDLTPYEYYLPFTLANVRNVGWLDKGVDFAKGNTPVKLVQKLYEILMKDDIFVARVNQIRGIHPCNLCEAHTFSKPFIGSCELWIPSLEADTYYAAPSLIIHYIEEHDYCPPKDFVESVLRLDLNSSFNGQALYDDLMKTRSASPG
jgi:hypothetical protein